MTCHLGHYDLSSWTLCILSSCTYELQSMQIILHVCKTIKDPSLIHKNIISTSNTSDLVNV